MSYICHYTYIRVKAYLKLFFSGDVDNGRGVANRQFRSEERAHADWGMGAGVCAGVGAELEYA
jgi:hypothetical protein